MTGRMLTVSVLALAVTASAVAVIYGEHRARLAFVELQSLQQERDRLDVKWGRLRLEQGAWETHGRVERLAREELGMRMPQRGEMKIVVLPTAGPVKR